MRKALIALDDSDSAMKAVEYAAAQFGGSGDLQIELVHVLPNLPAIFWDEGHILSDQEKKDRQKVVDKWIADKKAKMEPIFKKATAILTGSGMNPRQIMSKSISDSLDVAGSIMEETTNAGCQTVILGRCNHSAKHILGSITTKVINHAAGLAVIIVE